MQTEAWFNWQEEKLAEIRAELEAEKKRLGLASAISWEMEGIAGGMLRLVRDNQVNPPLHRIPGTPKTDLGLTLRDYFAGQALVGMMQAMRPYSNEYERSAKAAYEQADAMLAQRDSL
jgi:hypothetical protein